MRNDAQGEPLHYRTLAHTRLAYEYRVVFLAPAEYLDEPVNLRLPPNHRVHPARSRSGGQVGSVFFKLLQHGFSMGLDVVPFRILFIRPLPAVACRTAVSRILGINPENTDVAQRIHLHIVVLVERQVGNHLRHQIPGNIERTQNLGAGEFPAPEQIKQEMARIDERLAPFLPEFGAYLSERRHQIVV